jgi:hypothetical protein
VNSTDPFNAKVVTPEQVQRNVKRWRKERGLDKNPSGVRTLKFTGNKIVLNIDRNTGEVKVTS